MKTSFQGSLGTYEIIKTQDGTNTLYSEFFNENCHSTAGATSETLFNYIEGCQLLKQAKKLYQQNLPLNILEVGFGLGIGPKTTFEYFDKYFPQIKINFYSFELDNKLVDWAIEHTKINTNNYPSLDSYLNKKFNSTISIIIGDARKSIYSLQETKFKFHAIFQDPFCPQNNQSLWTKQWFHQLKQVAKDDCILSTYSASTKIRKALLTSGWKVFSAPGFQQKKESTRATISLELPCSLEKKLLLSPTPPLED